MSLQNYIVTVMNNAAKAGASGDITIECYLDAGANVTNSNTGNHVSFTLHIGDKHAEA